MAKQYDQYIHEGITRLGMPALTTDSSWTPNTDVYETPDSLVVKMEIAGIEKDDLSLTLNDRMLIVRGYRHDHCRESRRGCVFRQMEIDYGEFERRIIIPRTVDGRRVRAQFRNGFLHIELPKATQTEHTTLTIIIEQAS